MRFKVAHRNQSLIQALPTRNPSWTGSENRVQNPVRTVRRYTSASRVDSCRNCATLVSCRTLRQADLSLSMEFSPICGRVPGRSERFSALLFRSRATLRWLDPEDLDRV